MKTYIILNIISMALSVMATGLLVACANDAFLLTNEGFRKYYDAEIQKGKDGEEIFKNWEKRGHDIDNAVTMAMLLSVVVIFILSVISVCLKPNSWGIILMVISGFILLICFLISKYYRYSI